MVVHTSGSLGDVIQFVESGSFPGIEVGIGPMPGPGVGALIGGNALWLIDNGDPSRVGAANDVAMWLVRPEHLGPLDAVTGYVPPSEIVADDPSVQRAWAEHPQFRVAYDQLVSTPGSDATAGALYGPDKEIERLLFAATEALVSGTTTAHETLVQLTSQANELIAVFEKVNAAG